MKIENVLAVVEAAHKEFDKDNTVNIVLTFHDIDVGELKEFAHLQGVELYQHEKWYGLNWKPAEGVEAMMWSKECLQMTWVEK